MDIRTQEESPTSAPLISVIIATYGRPQLLLDCVASVCQGSYEDFEVVVVDQDPGGQVGDALTARFGGGQPIRYFNLPSAGASRARNYGLEQSRGAIAAFIDDDVLADEAWLTGVHRAFSQNGPTVQLVAGRIDPIWPSGRPRWMPREREFLLGLYDIGNLRCILPPDDQPIGANMAGRREFLLRLGGFDERLGPNCFRDGPPITGEDTLLGLRARNAGCSLFYEPDMRVYHRISRNKVKRSYFLKRHFWEGMTVVKEMEITRELPGAAIRIWRRQAWEIAVAGARFLLPRFRKNYDLPAPQIRMLALSRLTYSLGVIYSLISMTDETV